MRPLEGLLVLDFSIFLSGPSAALRLADLGARVIKVERPDVPCLDLVDLPGLTQTPKEKARGKSGFGS